MNAGWHGEQLPGAQDMRPAHARAEPGCEGSPELVRQGERSRQVGHSGRKTHYKEAF